MFSQEEKWNGTFIEKVEISGEINIKKKLSDPDFIQDQGLDDLVVFSDMKFEAKKSSKYSEGLPSINNFQQFEQTTQPNTLRITNRKKGS